jgi:exodeoxyribonuclease VII large subunit
VYTDLSKTPTALSVTQLNRQARTLLESHFDYVWVEGEISNFVAPSSGHWYFSLKDSKAQVRCAMFRNRNQRIKRRPANGDGVRVRCRVSLYEGRGEFQLIAEHLETAGTGATHEAFIALKSKLAAQGLFDPQRKQALPERVTHIGVITSPTGAAIADILTVLKRRSPSIEVSLFPVAVQGADSGQQICDAIARANRWQCEGKITLDALIIGRGGGSLEDLWAFNEERVALAIAASDLPTVSAVGHEIDFTIADFVADERAPTPSAAAELVSPDQSELKEQLAVVEQRLVRVMRRRIAEAKAGLENLRNRLRHPSHQLREQSQRLDSLEQRLHTGAQLRLERARSRATHLARLLDSLSPLGILQRGYAIISDSNGKVVADYDTLCRGDKLEARLAKGRVKLTVDESLADPE